MGGRLTQVKWSDIQGGLPGQYKELQSENRQTGVKIMRISVIGSGYVGLVSGAGLAEVGHGMVCMDIDADRIAKLRQGHSPIYEPGLDEMLLSNVERGHLVFTTSMEEAVNHAEAIMIAVGTPPSEAGSADLGHVLTVAGNIGRLMTRPLLVIVKSTVPVGTCGRVRSEIQAQLDTRGEDISFNVASNPEFLAEGVALKNFMQPDRIVSSAMRRPIPELPPVHSATLPLRSNSC